ncbi:helix-turn-helix domain-containing protein [Sediminispirochaeta smaragdinae]|uniref:Transcriptional regulator, XRE family n=1 Tax=Sediminispirochaeta smaragdinae (strain DSM 11293 / JCM 15392 / SEBR 4228) TaxID=573413 RepID=E1R3K6_SEDSS|nr:helix-turn-helix transcriptional regulator [Sediminispirochaeta smaragdinae]ADK81637.1 transcriptional regulator, XRE family [Sediminispirochaeta smaragdinae DSM 11293]
MDFWERLKTLIKEQKTTQEWVANKTGVSFGTFRKWMSRKTMPNADQAVEIADVLDTTVEYLVKGKSSDTWQPPRRYADIVKLLEELDDSELEAVKVLAEGYASRKRNKPQKET